MREFGKKKTRLSYSAISLWQRDKEGYRRRYYEGEPFISTPYTDFGNYIGDSLETGELVSPTLEKVPRYSEMEFKIERTIGDVPMICYLDSFDPTNLKILEYKTSIVNRHGVEPWSRLAVRKHTQLTIYALAVREMFGDYNPDLQLVWMETCWGKSVHQVIFGSKVMTEERPGLRLTGRVEIFDRHIESWELDRMAGIVQEVAEDISKDYILWKKTNKKSQTK